MARYSISRLRLAKPKGICGFIISDGALTDKPRLNGDANCDNCECMVWTLLARTVVVTETPTALPILRTRLVRPAPSVRSLGAKVAKDTMFMGTNTRPMPRPCTKVTEDKCQVPIWGVQPVMSHI